jgi:hypothetical protein
MHEAKEMMERTKQPGIVTVIPKMGVWDLWTVRF